MSAPTGSTSIRQARAGDPSLAKKVQKIIPSHYFCSLATATRGGTPHVVGINYKFVDGHLYFATGTSTKKARNIQQNPRVAVFIPVRKYPMGPPFSIQFQGTATVLSRDDPEIVGLLKAGKLKQITRFGVLDKEPDACFLKVKPARKIHTYGLGIPLRALLRNIAQGDRTVDLN